MSGRLTGLKGAGGLWPSVLASILILTPLAADAVIVNSLRGFSETEPGWSGGLGGALGGSGGNTEQSTLSADARLQWRGSADVWRLMGTAKRTSSGGTETARSVLGHLRHNHTLGGGWHTLAFVQLQENPFQRLNSRFLAGLGARLDIRREGAVHVSLGAADMIERERIDGQAGGDPYQRLSMFVSTVFSLREGVQIDALAFYQPKWSDMGDWRTYVNIALDVTLTGNVSLFTGLDLERDSSPPADVEATDWEMSTGLRIDF